MSIAVAQFVCLDTKLIVNTSRPGKAPFELDISQLRMQDIGPGLPFQFEATLVNPKPTGDIQSTGRFGPINERSPRDSAVQGVYTFTNADLGTLKGLAGTLSSTGQYGGTLGRISVDGMTDTPDFRLAVSGHPVPLHTEFHAVVDATDGDTYLEPVRAHWLHSSLIARGKVVRIIDPHGHNIELDVDVKQARIQDLLQLGIRTEPPVMTGAVTLHTKFHLPPGSEDLANRLHLAGTFHVTDGLFSSDKIQNRVDALSLRSQGKPKLARLDDKSAVLSSLAGDFSLANGTLSFASLDFRVPGTSARMSGRYTLDGSVFDFHGKLKLEAKLSQMVTGWKSILLKPVDPFFHKDGAGTELPFKITGTREEPHIGLDFHHRSADTGHDQTQSMR